MGKKHISVSLMISTIIILGFMATSLYSYYSFQKLFKEDVEAVSELTSENIFVNINNFMERPMNVSMAMSKDTFLRDFVARENEHISQDENASVIKNYLASYQKEYNFNSVFFVSASTGYYYHYENGADRVMHPENPENDWYYEFLKDPRECALNVDNDRAKMDIPTIFVNCKMYDENNNILGVVGVGLDTPYIQKFISTNEEAYEVKAYLIDKDGNVQISSTLTEFQRVNIFENEIFAAMKEAIEKSGSADVKRWYESQHADGYIVSKYVPNLNWYLVVEKSIVAFKERIIHQILVGMIFTLAVVAAVISMVTAINKKNKKELIYQAETDKLTGVKNRTCYELEVLANKGNLDNLDNFAIGVFDLNDLKKINDFHGHQAGDAYIKKVSELISEHFDCGSVFRIGGDEFAVTFIDVNEDELLESLKTFNEAMANEKVGEVTLSTAFGYAYYDVEVLSDVDIIFKAADSNMYLDKKRIKRERAEQNKQV